MQTSYIYYLVFNWQSRLILIQPLLPTHFGTVVIRQLRPEFKFPAKIDLAFSQIHISYQNDDDLTNPNTVLLKKQVI